MFGCLCTVASDGPQGPWNPPPPTCIPLQPRHLQAHDKPGLGLKFNEKISALCCCIFAFFLFVMFLFFYHRLFKFFPIFSL